jgi:hypothetical protein
MFNSKESVKSPRFQVHELVKVKSREEIFELLDSMNKLDGCQFMNQMWQFCEKEFKILKVVINFFDENRKKMYQVSGPRYLLEGIICDGKVESFKQTCDHSCYLLWHEDWLISIRK